MKKADKHYLFKSNTFFLHTDSSSLTPPDQPAWWRVDLGSQYDVYTVVIYNRDRNQGKAQFRPSESECEYENVL